MDAQVKLIMNFIDLALKAKQFQPQVETAKSLKDQISLFHFLNCIYYSSGLN
jgi:hypothetical protein